MYKIIEDGKIISVTKEITRPINGKNRRFVFDIQKATD